MIVVAESDCALIAFGGSAFAMTLMACYGRPRGEPSPLGSASAPTTSPTPSATPSASSTATGNDDEIQ